MFRSPQQHTAYVVENFPEVTDHRVDDNHWDLPCPRCKITRGFQVTRRGVNYADQYYHNRWHKVEDYKAPTTLYFICPVCNTFKQWVLFQFEGGKDKSGNAWYRYFRLASLPAEGIEDIDELPADPPALRTAYRQAIRAMDANAHIAAAAMFRRALQVITRDILGAKPANLAKELRECVGQKFNGVTITSDFADNGYIIKEAGNQAAHPDADPDLLDFTPEDAASLQSIFMELVSELWVVPEAMRKAKLDFVQRRKIATAGP